MSIRLQDVMLYGGGECLQRFGTPFWRVNREQDVAATLTRSGAVGGSYGPAGSVRQASANRLRTTWFDGVPYLLVEDSVQNLAYHTQAFSFTGANQWSRSGIASVTADDAVAPDGQTTADLIVENSSTSEHYVSNSFGINESNGDIVRFSVFAASDTRDEIQLEVSGRDGVNRNVWFDLVAGTVGTASNATGRIVAADGGFYRCTIEATVGSGGVTSTLRIYMGSGSETRSYLGNGSFGVHLWQADIVLNDYETSPIPATTALVTRSADTLYASSAHPPQAESWYMKFRETGAIEIDAAVLAHLGDGSDAPAQLMMHNNSGVYRFYHESSDGEGAAGSGFTAPTFGQVVELRGTIDADGNMVAGQSIAGGSEQTDTGVSSAALDPSFTGSQLHFGSRGSGARAPALQLAAFKRVRGVHSMADLRAVFP